jgi:putative FmdB family regulatory protein
MNALMPIYEYRCNVCKRPFSILVRSMSAEVNATCPRCGAQDARRLISRFATLRSEEAQADHLSDMAGDMAGVDENDPRSVARFARRMSQEMGEDAGPEFNEMVDRLEAGESPESIEQSLGGPDSDPGAGSDDL